MRDLRYIIIFLIIIILFHLGISSYREGLDCKEDETNSNGICVKNKSTIDSNYKQNPNMIYIVIILVMIIVWLVMLKQET